MFITLVVTYWTFLAISFGAFANFLWKQNPGSAILIVGFFVLGQAAKTLAELLLFKQKEAMIKKYTDNLQVQPSNNVKENV